MVSFLLHSHKHTDASRKKYKTAGFIHAYRIREHVKAYQASLNYLSKN